MLEAPTFYAKPALLHAVAALFAAAAAALVPWLPALLGVPAAEAGGGGAGVEAGMGGVANGEVGSSARLLDALRSADWPVRRAAAEALTVLMVSLGPALHAAPGPLLLAIEARLSEARHDKVKPARDAVNEAVAVARELRGYDGPPHDTAQWRIWVQHRVAGDRVGGDPNSGGCGGSGMGALGASPKSTRGHALSARRTRSPPPQLQAQSREWVTGGGRRALSEAFREAHFSGDAVLVPCVSLTPCVEHAREHADKYPGAETVRSTGTGATAREHNRDRDNAALALRARGPGQHCGGGGDDSEGHRVAPWIDPHQGSTELPPGEEAPAWISLAAQLDNQLDVELARSNRRLEQENEGNGARAGTSEAGPGEQSHVPQGQEQPHEGAGVRLKEGRGIGFVHCEIKEDEAGGSYRGSINAEGVQDYDKDADVRRQLGQLVAAQAHVLERLGVFVSETTAAIATLTHRMDALEGVVGAAASVSIAASANRVQERRDDTVEATDTAEALAKDRAALEDEKVALREAAAQLERAAAQLEQVVPGTGSLGSEGLTI